MMHWVMLVCCFGIGCTIKLNYLLPLYFFSVTVSCFIKAYKMVAKSLEYQKVL